MCQRLTPYLLPIHSCTGSRTQNSGRHSPTVTLIYLCCCCSGGRERAKAAFLLDSIILDDKVEAGQAKVTPHRSVRERRLKLVLFESPTWDPDTRMDWGSQTQPFGKDLAFSFPVAPNKRHLTSLCN